MQTITKIPDYLSDDFALFLENMTSLSDPENPDLLSNYLHNLFEQLKSMPLLFNGMVDQLAMAISSQIRINAKELAKVDLSIEPSWEEIKPFVGVHAQARECITEIMSEAEQDLKIAVLLNHFYAVYDATPLKGESEDEYEEYDSYDNDYDENY